MFDVGNLNAPTRLVLHDGPPGSLSDSFGIWQTSPSTSLIHFSISQPRARKFAERVDLGLFTDVFPLKVSHLFHSQTVSNWIVNLWWRLIMRLSSEVLMRSYFSRMTSPQITPGDSGLWVWTCFPEHFFSLREKLKCHFCALPGPSLVTSLLKAVLILRSVQGSLSISLCLPPPHSVSRLC